MKLSEIITTGDSFIFCDTFDEAIEIARMIASDNNFNCSWAVKQLPETVYINKGYRHFICTDWYFCITDAQYETVPVFFASDILSHHAEEPCGPAACLLEELI